MTVVITVRPLRSQNN